MIPKAIGLVGGLLVSSGLVVCLVGPPGLSVDFRPTEVVLRSDTLLSINNGRRMLLDPVPLHGDTPLLRWLVLDDRDELVAEATIPYPPECAVVLSLGRLLLRCPEQGDHLIALVSNLPDPLLEGAILDSTDRHRHPLLSSAADGLKYSPRATYWTDADGRLRPRWRSYSMTDQIELPSGEWLVHRNAKSKEGRFFSTLMWITPDDTTTRRFNLVEFDDVFAIDHTSSSVRMFVGTRGYASNASPGYFELEARTLKRIDDPGQIASNWRRPVVQHALGLGVVLLVLARLCRRRWLLALWLALALAACVWVGYPLWALWKGGVAYW